MAGRTAEEESREALQQYREIVANTVGYVRSREVTRSYTSVSLEELIDNRIERIEASATDGRPGALAQLDKIKNDFDGAIESIKQVPPDAFRRPDPDTDANTSDDTGETA